MSVGYGPVVSVADRPGVGAKYKEVDGRFVGDVLGIALGYSEGM